MEHATHAENKMPEVTIHPLTGPALFSPKAYMPAVDNVERDRTCFEKSLLRLNQLVTISEKIIFSLSPISPRIS